MQFTRRSFVQYSSLLTAGLYGPTQTASAVSSDASETGQIQGTVTHFGQPIEDAIVRILDGDSTVTDEDGSFTLDAESGTRTGSVTADGYAPATRDVEITAGTTTTLNFSLDQVWGPKTGKLDIAVTEVGGGETIPCQITLFGDETETVFAPRGAIPDGESWERELTVSEGWWELRISNADGYSDGYERVYVDAGETEFAWVQLDDGEDEIPETGRIEGRVIDERATAIDDATIVVGDELVSTDDDGTFELDVPHGRYDTTTSAPGYEDRHSATLVKFGRTTELTIALESE